MHAERAAANQLGRCVVFLSLSAQYGIGMQWRLLRTLQRIKLLLRGSNNPPGLKLVDLRSAWG